ncbi:MAG: type II toxin-antitoxin system RelE/ParE family toxin [Nanoarchaeota archaeon]|nr:type II toxin-antitoxin system RelE/ParE family toxin [Nanoarchaeota archaeon]MBU4116770.1 type II toxin-antitoxin system RelE/ParE family toxin [Nanoarchaeota archaeon]
MVRVEFTKEFRIIFSKIKDGLLRTKIKKQLSKIKDNPEIGKPMTNIRKRTRELHIKPFRLSYSYFKNEDKIILLDLYHKKEQ